MSGIQEYTFPKWPSPSVIQLVSVYAERFVAQITIQGLMTVMIVIQIEVKVTFPKVT